MTNNHKWITNLIKNLDEKVEKDTKIDVLESVGRKCISPNMIARAKEVYLKSKDLDDFYNKYSKINTHFQKIGKEYFMIYPKCYCSNVKSYPNLKEISPTYCYCSVGWAKELFEKALEREVEVELIHSIIGGANECKFKLKL